MLTRVVIDSAPAMEHLLNEAILAHATVQNVLVATNKIRHLLSESDFNRHFARFRYICLRSISSFFSNCLLLSTPSWFYQELGVQSAARSATKR